MDHYGYGLMRQRSGVWRSLRDGEFEEEDVWDVLRDRRDDSGGVKSVDSSISIPKKKPSTTARMIPTRPNAFSSGGGGSTSDSSQEAKRMQQSAPVNIPDWSGVARKKVAKKPSKRSAYPWPEDDGYDHAYGYDHDNGIDGAVNCSDGDDDEDEDDDLDGDEDGEHNINYRVPPHEIIARRMARSHISSFSVFEGVGRTLKGRDLKKVRNAVLTKTGFLESL